LKPWADNSEMNKQKREAINIVYFISGIVVMKS